ncbi:MAG: Flp pilus assembly complex ATPase component TadA [Planctomycetaceae bacterium]|nr:Flp pilus assembly complex ATPase component TadA [Planctomycetaceae bacterium]
MPPTTTVKPDPSDERFVQAELKGRRLGRALTKLGKVTREQVHQALALQQGEKKGKKLGQILVEMGLITASDLQAALSGMQGMAFVSIAGRSISDEARKSLTAETARSYQVVPIQFDPATKRLVIAMKGPENIRAVDDLRMLMGFKVSAVVAQPEEVDAILAEHYVSQDSVKEVLANIEGSSAVAALEGRGASIDLATLNEAANDNNVVQLLNLVLLQAIRDKASDIHLEPFEDEFKMRYRIDGVLYEMQPPPKAIAMAIVSRVKVMAKLDIAERRLPQDGRIELTLNNAPVDLRVAVLPTMFGESVVMRVLDRGNVQLSLDRIGLREDDLEKMRTLINKPNGIVIVTGPTGSGKTTTLYAALNELNTPDTKILTAEDPVEYDIEGMIQCQVNVDQELTFGKLLRSFLRQDPDIILVGEVRDLETAQISIQASLTGHLVFTTLHTNDAPSSILRLADLGVENFLLTATLEGIVAQRLVRRICAKCKEEFVPTEEMLMELALKPENVKGRTFYRGKGCDVCNKTGYKGRMALFEIMTLDDTIRELIMAQANTSVLRNECRKRGMRTLREVGLLGIYDGQTTIDEVVRETLDED